MASEHIADDAKTLSEAARVLSTDFVANQLWLLTHTGSEMRNRRLQGVNAMRRKIQAAMLEWKTQISAQSMLVTIGSTRSISTMVLLKIFGWRLLN